jgi:hypothetical protein
MPEWTAEQARARARALLDAQKRGQVIKFNIDGTPVPATEPATYGKKIVLHDRKGEFAFDFFERDSPEFRMDTQVHGIAHRHEIERKKLASAWNAIAIDPPGYGVITTIAGSFQPIPDRDIRDFQIVVSNGYPNTEPRAYAYGWTATGPHAYKDGHLCLWHPNDWSPKYTLAYVVGKTYLWIYKHEEYLRSGQWLGNQQRH